MRLDKLRDNPTLLLMLGATIVAVSRYVVVFAFAERFTITGAPWQWFNALSGVGMAVLEGVAVWFCWSAWSQARPSTERNVLLVLIVAMFATITGAVMPALQATTLGAGIADVLPGSWLWLWSGCVTIAPLLVMAASGLADHVETAQPAATDAQPAIAMLQNEDDMDEEEVEPAKLTLKDVVAANPEGSMTDWAKELGMTRQAVAGQIKRLEGAGKVRRNGHVEWIESN